MFDDDPYECKAATELTNWERWIAMAERLAGHTLDGDQEIDGYSLDFAADEFEAGKTVAEYIATLPANHGELKYLSEEVNA